MCGCSYASEQNRKATGCHELSWTVVLFHTCVLIFGNILKPLFVSGELEQSYKRIKCV